MELKMQMPIIMFFFACVFFLGFFYFNSKSFIYKNEAKDISDIGLGMLKGNMHVKMDVEKINFYKYACLCSAILCTIVGAIYTNRFYNRS